ncbi:formyltetrahydrofolate deformylase, partial [Salmonella enterica]|nr:formyltetrahydrofolate deformylase [Salmonella enterica]
MLRPVTPDSIDTANTLNRIFPAMQSLQRKVLR